MFLYQSFGWDINWERGSIAETSIKNTGVVQHHQMIEEETEAKEESWL